MKHTCTLKPKKGNSKESQNIKENIINCMASIYCTHFKTDLAFVFNINISRRNGPAKTAAIICINKWLHYIRVGEKVNTSWGRAGPSSAKAWLKMLTAMMKALSFESGRQP